MNAESALCPLAARAIKSMKMDFAPSSAKLASMVMDPFVSKTAERVTKINPDPVGKMQPIGTPKPIMSAGLAQFQWGVLQDLNIKMDFVMLLVKTIILEMDLFAGDNAKAMGTSACLPASQTQVYALQP